MGATRATEATARGLSMRRRVLLVATVVAGLLGMTVATHPQAALYSVSLLNDVPHGVLLLCALLLVGNEFLKGARWALFLRAGRVRIGLWDAISTHIASQAINVLPANEWLAARLVDEHRNGTRRPQMAQATPAIILRWICDVIALACIATVGVAYYRGFTPMTLLPVPVVVAVAALLRAKRPARWIARRLAQWGRTRGLVRSETQFHRAAVLLIQPRTLLAGVALSCCTTGVAALTLYALARSTGSDAFGLPQALVTQALAALAAMFSFIPNGFGVIDGSIAGWMYAFGVGVGELTFVTVAVRLLNIVVRTACGIAMVLTRYRFLWAGGGRQFLRRMLRGEMPASPLVPVVVPAPVPVAAPRKSRKRG